MTCEAQVGAKPPLPFHLHPPPYPRAMWSEVASHRDPMCDVMLSRGHGGSQGRFTLQNLILGHQFASKLVSQQEEQMRVDAEEPMSPMSPMSQGSDHDHEKPAVRQVKLEESGEEQTVYSSQPASHTDSPVPPRSDSGCEVLPGPYTPSQSPLLPRLHPHTHSPTHLYSPTQSPGPSRHVSGFSSPYSHTPSTGLSRNNSDASQYGGSYNSYSSAPSPISPTHYSPSQSPIQQRHINFPMPTHQSPNLGRVPQYTGAAPGALYSAPLDLRESHNPNPVGLPDCKETKEDDRPATDLQQHSVLAAQSGITRQQLINSPCPICGDKISGFHYGIFSCESCKGFFKRTVQNKKNYVCMRGSTCTVSTSTRKKCPACRFDKCLCMGMKLEAIREDRTRGGRSTYQCSPYPLPPSLVTPTTASGHPLDPQRLPDATAVKAEPSDGEEIKPSPSDDKRPVPLLLQQIHDVEHLWHCSESEMEQLRQSEEAARHAMENNSPDFLNNLCHIADHRLYKIVKWCKSLPLFRHITIDDQICLLINSWCELLLLSCCFRSMDSPGEIRVSSGRTMTLQQAEAMGIGPCIERMLNLTYQLSRLQVDKYEYMAMKVIVLLSSDVSGLQEGEKVRDSQKKVVQALQEYTLTHYPHLPPKFGELLLRIPELQRTCQASKEMLSMKKKEGDVPSFNFLFELLRGDH